MWSRGRPRTEWCAVHPIGVIGKPRQSDGPRKKHATRADHLALQPWLSNRGRAGAPAEAPGLGLAHGLGLGLGRE